MAATVDPLVRELEPAIERLLDRHYANAQEWFPHELVPWERGCANACSGPLPQLSAAPAAAVNSALVVNLLTEDNLPYYFRTLSGIDGGAAWSEWSRRWTAEEGRHSIVIRDYLTVSGAVDPIALERGRMHQVSHGVAPELHLLTDALAYTSLQELATRISHRNTGKLLSDRVGFEIMRRVAADENLHFLFYRDAALAAFAIDPSAMMISLDRVVRDFVMPGVGIPDFERHARAIAALGVYDFGVHHDQILVPVVLHQFDVTHVTGLSAEAEVARDRLVAHIERVGRVARRLEVRRHEQAALDHRTDTALAGA
jgi:acyl-[acyl-carrier-protein] desaturase